MAITTRSKQIVRPEMTRIQSQAALRAICKAIRESSDTSDRRALIGARDAFFKAREAEAEQAP